jgi:hypothetical protein
MFFEREVPVVLSLILHTCFWLQLCKDLIMHATKLDIKGLTSIRTLNLVIPSSLHHLNVTQQLGPNRLKLEPFLERGIDVSI